MIRLFNAFVKLTGLPAALLVFRTKVYYEDKAAQGRHIKGAAVLVSNHTSVFDYAVYLFVFFTRTLRTLMAEVLFEKATRGKAMHGFTKNYIRVELSPSEADPSLDNQLVTVRLGDFNFNKTALKVCVK